MRSRRTDFTPISRDADALLKVLEEEVIPLYYDRDRDGLPAAGGRSSDMRF